MLFVAYLEFLSLESKASSKDLLCNLNLAVVMAPPAAHCSEMPVGLSLSSLSVSEKEDLLEGTLSYLWFPAPNFLLLFSQIQLERKSEVAAV